MLSVFFQIIGRAPQIDCILETGMASSRKIFRTTFQIFDIIEEMNRRN